MNKSLIDFHTHILPNMDDGSRSVEESLQMIRSSVKQGVACIALTPHFYADRDNPTHFLQKRERCCKKLLEQADASFPLLLPGAEVAYFEGITCMEELQLMRIGKSKCLLVEMPFRVWTGRVIDDILELSSRSEYRVIIAHIERYAHFQDEDVLFRLIEQGVLMQSNASFFLSWKTRKKALNMLERGFIHLLGSDCHNMSSRSPNLGAACELITKKGAFDAVESVMKRGVKLLMTNTGTEKQAFSGNMMI